MDMDTLWCIMVAMTGACIIVLLYIVLSVVEAIERYVKGFTKRRRKEKYARRNGGKAKWAR